MVDVVPHGEAEYSRLEALLGQWEFVAPDMPEPDEADEEEDWIEPPVPIPVQATVIGRRYGVGDPVSIITSAGTSQLKVSGLARPGNGQDDRLVLMLAGKVRGGPFGLAVVGARIPAERKLKAPVAVDLKTVANKGVLSRIRARMKADVPAEQRKMVAGVALLPEHVTMVHGRFPGGATALVTVDVPELSEADGTEHFTALFLADAAGNLVRWIYKPEVRIEFHPIYWLVDVDGDGLDEVLFGMEYYEGDYLYLLRWKDGAPVTAEIAGEGV